MLNYIMLNRCSVIYIKRQEQSLKEADYISKVKLILFSAGVFQRI